MRAGATAAHEVDILWLAAGTYFGEFTRIGLAGCLR
jgi:hypothetical protein